MRARDSMELGMAADGGTTMAAGLVAKLAPAGVGALIMVAVGPKTITRREVFLRAFVALGTTYLFGDLALDYVSLTYSWFNPVKHSVALYGLMGCVGWGAMGGLSVVVQRFKRRPLETVREVRDALKD
jgi:hypothetical protein